MCWERRRSAYNSEVFGLVSRAYWPLSCLWLPISSNFTGVHRGCGSDLVIFLAYVAAISHIQEIQRVFMYHGAEHKAVHTLEAGHQLSVENARDQSTLHPRCGTSFLLIVMVLSILVFTGLGEGPLWWRVVSRVAVFPVVAGLGYELIKLTSRYANQRWAKCLMAPGLWLQKLTTGEPDEAQMEVALRALQAVVLTNS